MRINSIKVKDFLSYMAADEIAMEAGFKLAVEKKYTLDLYQEFKRHGFLTPSVKYQQKLNGNLIDAPFWPALIYLEALVDEAPPEFAGWGGILESFKEIFESEYGNYRTNFKLIEICSKLPEVFLTNEILMSASKNIVSDVDNSLALSIFINKLCPRIVGREGLSSGLFECVKNIYAPISEVAGESWEGKQFFKADPYWLKLFAERYAFKIGEIFGKQYLAYMRPILEGIFPSEPIGYPTWLIRPAVEDHDQNKDWYSSENIAIISVRDAILGLCESNVEKGKQEISKFYNGPPIERRIAIHVLGKNYSNDEMYLRDLLNGAMFDDDLIHETYQFLKVHFESFGNDLQNLIIEIFVSRFDVSSNEDALLRKVIRWLSAMESSGNQRIANMISSISKNKLIGLPEHPDFFAYMESGFGPGPTPFTVQEILYFLDQDEISNELNNFKGSDDIFSENRESLCKELESAVKLEPIKFIEKLELLNILETPYKYAIANAYANIYSRGDFPGELKMDSSISPLIKWVGLTALELSNAKCVTPISNDSPNAVWLVMAMADLIKSISRSDENTFEQDYQIESLDSLKLMLKVVGKNEYSDLKDPMHHAINSPRGRVLEAIILLALRACRHQKNIGKSPVLGWQYFEPFFDCELALLDSGESMEFCSLVSRYILQFNFMSGAWIANNCAKIINPKNKIMFECAMDGIAYAPSSSLIYNFLKNTGALERGMKYLSVKSTARKKLLERIILAYSWGEEEFSSQIISQIFDESNALDLEESLNFLWSISNQEIEESQKLLIIDYWSKTAQYVLKINAEKSRLCEALIKLIPYFDDFDEKTTSIFMSLLPHAEIKDSSYFVVNHLIRLFRANPINVSKFAAAYVEKSQFQYDYESKWLELTNLMLGEGDCKSDADSIILVMQANPGFKDLYRIVSG